MNDTMYLGLVILAWSLVAMALAFVTARVKEYSSRALIEFLTGVVLVCFCTGAAGMFLFLVAATMEVVT